MRRSWIRPIALAVSLAFFGSFSAGCYGKFGLSKKIYDWNATLGNKFVISLVFSVMCIIPIYELTLLVDWILLNVIEFWTGSNPVGMNEGETKERLVINDDGSQMRMIISDRGNAMRVEITEPGKATKVMQLRRTADGIEELDGAGTLVASAQADGYGGVAVVSANGALVAQKSAGELESLASALDRGAGPLVVALEAQRDLSGLKLAKAAR